MARGRRCCCCMDCYYDNYDSLVVQFRLHPNNPNPDLKNIVSGGSSHPIVDYRNKLVLRILSRVVGGTQGYYTGFTDFNLGTPGNNPSMSSRWTGTAGVDFIPGIASDWKNKRFFYCILESFTPVNKFQIRGQNYDGTNDYQVVDEPAIGVFPVTPFTRSLQFNSLTQKLYYLRGYQNPTGTGHSELVTINPDGTGKVIKDLTSGLAAVNDPTVGVGGAFHWYAFEKNLLIRATTENFGPDQHNYIYTVDLTSGVRTILLHTLHSLSTGFTDDLRYSSVYYCIKDKKIYFFGGGRLSSLSGFFRVNIDGTGMEKLFDFGRNALDTLHYGGPNIGWIMPGCGFEDTGERYNGP